MVPPTVSPAENSRKGPSAPNGPGKETPGATEAAMMSNPGPGPGRNVGGPGLDFNGAAIKDALK